MKQIYGSLKHLVYILLKRELVTKPLEILGACYLDSQRGGGCITNLSGCVCVFLYLKSQCLRCDCEEVCEEV